MVSRKITAAIMSAILFYVISCPYVYNFVDSVLGPIVGPISNGGCPTQLGLFMHSAVFGLVAYSLMQ